MNKDRSVNRLKDLPIPAIEGEVEKSPNNPHTSHSYQLDRLGVIMESQPDNSDESMGVLNPATARGLDGKLYMFARIVADNNYSRIGIAEVLFNQQGDPTGAWRLGYALEPTESYERNQQTAGCEDPRITFVEPLGCYVMTYTAYGPLGPRIALAKSKDLLSWERIGPVKFAFMPDYRVDFDLYDNKDAYLFPTPVLDPHGHWALAMIHRPAHRQGWLPGMSVLPDGVTEPRASMWIWYCSIEPAQRDTAALLIWRDHCLLATPAEPWEAVKIGGGTPPVLTAQGWLTLYHGVSGHIVEGASQQPNVQYAAGVMILDIDDPRKVIYRSAHPILKPLAAEERFGTVPNVVFPTGVDLRADPGEPAYLDVYYGMADAKIGAARMRLP